MWGWERVTQLTVQKLLRFPWGAAIDVEATRGAHTNISLAELAALNGLDAELALLDGIVATAAEINRAADVSTRLVVITASGGITEVVNEGKVNLLGEVGGNALLALTLPAASGGGARYFFVVSVANTSTYTIACAGSDVFNGQIMGSADGGNTINGWETSTGATITLNAGTQGGLIGDWIELVDILAGVWSVSGQIVQSSSEATPFS